MTVSGNDVADGDDGVVLITIRPDNEHVVIVAPTDRCDVMVTATAASQRGHLSTA